MLQLFEFNFSKFLFIFKDQNCWMQPLIHDLMVIFLYVFYFLINISWKRKKKKIPEIGRLKTTFTTRPFWNDYHIDSRFETENAGFKKFHVHVLLCFGSTANFLTKVDHSWIFGHSKKPKKETPIEWRFWKIEIELQDQWSISPGSPACKTSLASFIQMREICHLKVVWYIQLS